MAEAEARARIDLVLMTRALTIPLWGRDLEAAAHSYAFGKCVDYTLKNEELTSTRRVGSDFVSRLSHRSSLYLERVPPLHSFLTNAFVMRLTRVEFPSLRFDQDCLISKCQPC